MKLPIDKIILQQEAWFKTWFNSAFYHKLYKNRNEQEAAFFIDALLHYLQPQPGSRMLDLGCGAGRHSKYLAQKGYDVTGLDLAMSSIREARKWESPTLRFQKHDMRNPFGINSYHYIFNLFTSFGYFEDKAENDVVVSNIANALRENGYVVFDYLNVAYAEEHLVAVEEKEIDGTIYHINRWSTDRFIYKRITVQDIGLSQPLEYVEKVARFNVADFEQFFDKHGLQTEAVFGDYDLDAYDVKSSKRLILLAKKKSL